ncbi:MAG TPA: YaiI/YqxD family protein [Holophagaceae bacterium]|nr:YaiI/YqxD family protein [Holophagaceae bacterium]
MPDAPIRILVDADACPVKEEVYRVARRCGCTVTLVANSRLRVPPGPMFEMVVVGRGQLDAADDWIVEQADARCIVVTTDIPLAARSLEKGAKALDPKGRAFTPESIGDALASRELSSFLRDMGDLGGGPAPFTDRDRSRFLQRLDDFIQAILKGK